MGYEGIYVLAFVWLCLISCSQVRGRLIANHEEGHDFEKISSGDKVQYNLERKIFLEKRSRFLARSNESLSSKIQPSTNAIVPEDNGYTHHWATYLEEAGRFDNFYGTKALLVVYGFPDIQKGQRSSATIDLSSGDKGPPEQFNTVQVGWHVHPDLYGDTHTHFFVSWTADGYKSTGCYNFLCKGFVLQNSTSFIPGSVIDPVSIIDGQKREITLQIFKDQKSGDWWLYTGQNDDLSPVGYWPKSLFTTLADSATSLAVGGFVGYKNGLASPPMGSGRYPMEGEEHAAAFRGVQLMSKTGAYFLLQDPGSYLDNSDCYNIGGFSYDHFLYGGPGGC